MNTLTTAVLSWNDRRTLVNTLSSYNEFGLNTISNEKLIWFQEKSTEDVHIAKTFKYKSFGSSTNIGIGGAYKKLVEKSTGDFFLFLENDWVLLEDASGAISEAQELLSSGTADVVRFRHRRFPGKPLYTIQFKNREHVQMTHLLDCVHWRDTPEQDFEQIDKVGNFYTTSSKFANWTNNPTMFRRKWLLENIAPLIDGDIEKGLQPWWEQQEFKVAQHDVGLFTHNRIG